MTIELSIDTFKRINSLITLLDEVSYSPFLFLTDSLETIPGNVLDRSSTNFQHWLTYGRE